MTTIKVKTKSKNKPVVPVVEMPYVMLTVRFMFDDGHVLDVMTPFHNSHVSEYALDEATRLFGKRAARKVVGSTVVGSE